jgi:DNA-binding transcriptional regulator LsrR (DeoR family)
MQHIYSDELLCLTARLYYVDGLGQGEVAKFVQVSQAKVSRLLAMAKERGIVRVTVADYEPRNEALETEIRKRFQLSSVVVIKTLDGLDKPDLRRTIGHFAAPILNEIIKEDDTVALAGGRTIYELIHSLPKSKGKDLSVVQAMGSVDSSVSEFDAQEVGREMTQRLGGRYFALNTPAFISTAETCKALVELEQVKRVREMMGKANLAIIGVGTLEDSVFIDRGVLSEDDLKDLRKAGVVGEICGRFIDKDGKECSTAWRDLVISMDFEQLRRIPQVIAVVSGQNRSEALFAAIRGKLVKGLIINQAGAAELLEFAANQKDN